MGLPAPWPTEQLFARGGATLSAHLHGIDGFLPPHSHTFAELVVVLGGRGVQRSAEGDRALAAGDLLLLPPGVWHAYRSDGLRLLDCCLGLDLLHQGLGWMAQDPASAGLWAALAAAGPAPRLRTATLDAAQLAAATAAGRALEAVTWQRSPPALTAIARLCDLLAVLATAVPAATTHHPGAPAVLAGDCRALMEQDLARAWTLTGLARRLGCDRTHLARLFRRDHGLPPMAWLAQRRAERAAELLAATDWPIARVAVAVGWPQPHHFARRFRQCHGVSASAWRARAAGQGAVTA